MNEKTFLPYAHQSINSEDITAVSHVLHSASITRGPEVEAFENEIAAYCGAKYAVAFSSGTTALIAAGFAAQTGPSDRLITSPNTFIGTVAAGIHFGARPVFIDLDPSNGSISLDQLALNANQPATRGKSILLPVHFGGIPIDMRALNVSLANPDSIIIEDAAHALGSHYPDSGPKVGSCMWSDMTIFSFHPAKTITTGEGGMVTTNDETLAHRLRLYRDNGIERDQPYLLGKSEPGYYEVHAVTNNCHLTEMQAALGRSQLRRIHNFIEKRRVLIKYYRQALRNIQGITLFTDSHDEYTAFHLCVIKIDYPRFHTNRVEVMNRLKEKGIGTQVHYIPLYRHSYFVKQSGEIDAYFPNTEDYYSQALTLPLFYDMHENDVMRVVQSLKDALHI